MHTLWPWITLALLGVYHGINPAMGWLFAVALGVQERRRSAVMGAFAPIALGHAISVGLVVALVVAAQTLVPPDALRIAGAAALIGFGVYKLAVRTHPRWVGMRVGFRDLTAWSFLMSTAHGAGLMLVPVLLPAMREPTVHAAHAELGQHAAHVEHLQMATTAAVPLAELGAVAVHTAAMFLVMAVIAVVVYEYVGLAVLRRAWFNLDQVWAGGLTVAGAVALVV